MTIPLPPLEVAITRRGAVRYFVPVGSATVASLQAVTSYDISGAWVMSFKVSNDGANAYDLTTATTLSAAGVTRTCDISGWSWVVAEISTNGTAGTVTPIFNLGGTQ